MYNDTTTKKDLETYRAHNEAYRRWEEQEARRDTLILISYSLISFAIVAGLFNLMFA